MSDSNRPSNRGDRIARDADTITGFFGTRAGSIVTVCLIGAAVVCGILAWVFG
jgi:hypothetical protein